MSPTRRAAAISLAAAIFLVGIKLVVGFATGSLGVLAEAVHSAADSFAALLTLCAVTIAERPADRGHQYGHGKAQNLGALAETVLLVVAAVWIAVEALGRFDDHGAGPHSAGIGIALMLFVLAVDASRAIVARRTARTEHSAALYANSWHFATDFAGSLAVLIGLVLAAAGHADGDAVAALVVAAIVMIVAISLAVGNVGSLMDRAPAGLDRTIVEAALAVPGVDEVRAVRVRESGGEVFADVVIGVPRLSGLERSHETTDAVEQAVEQAVERAGRTSVTVHVEPTDIGERAAERVAAAALRVPGVMEVHNIAVLDDGVRREVTLHARVDEGETLGGVEQTLARLRTEIARDLDAGDVHIHLEPFAPEAQEARDVTAIEPARVAAATRAAEAAAGAHCLVELWRQDERLVAVCALEADRSISVRAAHVLAGEIEDAVREAVPELADVIVEVSARTAADA